MLLCDLMMIIRVSILLGVVMLLAGCAEERRTRTVTEYLDDPILLEAAMISCGRNRSESRYETECINARQAVSILEARQERARSSDLEAQSERKRQALRRTQQAAAEVRRRAEVAERERVEAEYLAQFGELVPVEDSDATSNEAAANAPIAIIPNIRQDLRENRPAGDVLPATDGGNAPIAEKEPETDSDAT